MTRRVLLVEDDEQMRSSTAQALELAGFAVEPLASGEEALALAGPGFAGAVVSDIRMPGMDGIAMLRSLRERGDATPVLLLTTFDDGDLPLQAAEAGAQGFLLKDAAPEDLREAITRVAAGDCLLQPVSPDPVRARFRFRDDAPPVDTFSEREVAILRLLAGGYSNREIARSLFLAEGTVKNYVSVILDKLGTRDRTRAVLKAITLRVI